MATFTYKGTTRDGTSVTETVEAADRYAVYEVARQNEHTVSSVSEVSNFSLERFLNVEKINTILSRVMSD